jgi:hypothetical protein
VLQASPYRAARLVHFGLVLGVVMIVLVFAVVRPALGVEVMDQLTTVLRIVAVLLLFATVVVMRLVRSQIERRSAPATIGRPGGRLPCPRRSSCGHWPTAQPWPGPCSGCSPVIT